MLVPVGLGDGCVGDMWLLRVVLGVAVRLRGACHWRALLDVVGVDGHHASGGLVGRHVDDGVEENGQGKRRMSNKSDEGRRLVAQKKIELRSGSGGRGKGSNNDGKLHHDRANDEVEGRWEGAREGEGKAEQDGRRAVNKAGKCW